MVHMLHSVYLFILPVYVNFSLNETLYTLNPLLSIPLCNEVSFFGARNL